MLAGIGAKLVGWLGGGTLLAALAFGGVWLWHQWQTGQLERALAEARGEASELRASRDEWRAAAERRAARLDEVIAERDAAHDAVAELQAELEDTAADYRALRRNITERPPADDGPVAPVLRDALAGLP